jgi:hypothetical protein
MKAGEKQKQQMKEYYQENKKQILERNKQWREKNKKQILKKKKEKYWKNREVYLKRMKENWKKNGTNYLEDGRIRHKIWYEENRSLALKKISEYQKIKKKQDPNFKLMRNLRRLLNQSINYYERKGIILKSKKYPIDFQSIIDYLSPFPDRKIFQIDHIKPLCSFDLTDPEQIKIAFSPENHQWLLAQDNLKKGRKTE